jgi:hypothetical protein
VLLLLRNVAVLGVVMTALPAVTANPANAEEAAWCDNFGWWEEGTYNACSICRSGSACTGYCDELMCLYQGEFYTSKSCGSPEIVCKVA